MIRLAIESRRPGGAGWRNIMTRTIAGTDQDVDERRREFAGLLAAWQRTAADLDSCFSGWQFRLAERDPRSP